MTGKSEDQRELPEQTASGTGEVDDYLADRLAALGVESPARRRAKRVAPWLMSTAIHAGLLVVGLLVTWTVVSLQKDEESVLIIADFDATTYEPVAVLEQDTSLQTDRTVQDRLDIEPDAVAEFPSDLADWESDPINLIANTGSESSLAAFAPKPLQGSATFIGLTSTNARRIVYVIDASGSMMATLQIVVQELARSLDGLSPPQQFGIVFFQRNEAVVVPPANRLTLATEPDKTRAMNWIRAGRNILPGGRSNPLKALEHALRQEPDVVFLLSTNITGSGEFEIDQQDLLTRLDQLNPVDPKTGRRGAQINCIQFLDPDPLGTLELIAREHGGERGYKFLGRQELGLNGP